MAFLKKKQEQVNSHLKLHTFCCLQIPEKKTKQNKKNGYRSLCKTFKMQNLQFSMCAQTA